MTNKSPEDSIQTLPFRWDLTFNYLDKTVKRCVEQGFSVFIEDPVDDEGEDCRSGAQRGVEGVPRRRAARRAAGGGRAHAVSRPAEHVPALLVVAHDQPRRPAVSLEVGEAAAHGSRVGPHQLGVVARAVVEPGPHQARPCPDRLTARGIYRH